MEKRVALFLMLLLQFPFFIFPAVIPSASPCPKVRRFFDFPENHTLKKCCASHFIRQHGCRRVENALRICPPDIRIAVQNHIAAIKAYVLVQVGSNVQEAQVDKLNLIIQYAAQQNRLDIIKVIMEYVYVNDGQPAICLLAANGYAEGCRHLLENGEDVDRANILGKTPLICASQRGKRETAALLLQKNANPNLKTVCNKNAMEIAYDNGYADIALLIVQTSVKRAQKELDSIILD